LAKKGTARSDYNTSIEDSTYEIKCKKMQLKANTRGGTIQNTKRGKYKIEE